MVKLRTATSTLACALIFFSASTARAQATPTEPNTKRPTPIPTATRTPSVIPATPTRPAGGGEVFLCSAGVSDGAQCLLDEDCPAGACVLAQGVCAGGSGDGDYCESSADCAGGGQCEAAQRVCLGGPEKGVSCLRDDQCTESSCISSGLFCDAGDFELFSCIDNGGCEGQFESGNCQSPDVLLCSGGANNGDICRSALDCIGGACILAQKICDGGEADKADCEGVYDCPGGTCTPTSSICSAGENEAFGCLSSAACPGGVCLSTGRLCDGGAFDGFSCTDDDSCSPEGDTPAPCVTPGPDFYCSAGDNDGGTCASDDECPGGACILTQGVCDGGSKDGDLCDANADCASPGLCVQTQKVCLAGNLQGAACAADRHCGSGIVCGSSGLFCSGGDFEGLSCVIDDNCCDDDGCQDTDANDGACFAPSVFLCSGGANANQACESHADCPSGACVEAQRVCDGGGDDFDGGGCQGSVNCGGAPCVATSRICIRNGTIDGETIEVEGFGCLRDDHCFGAGAGSCMATGQTCDGGTTSASDYDPFALSLSCTDDQICRDFLGDNSLSCVAPADRGFACSAGSNDGNRCSNDTDCPGNGRCVLQDALCTSGSRNAQVCDTGADCPGGSCQPTQRVCSISGLSCVNASQCDPGESCISSGRVCSGSSFGAFSCVDDANCYDSDTPDEASGACVGAEPRLCSLDAPCILEGLEFGEVFGFSVDPLESPATFDFYSVPIAPSAAGVVVVLRPTGGDVDLYVGREATASIEDPADYPFASNNSDDSTDSVRITAQSDPTYADFTMNLAEFAVAVVGLGGDPTYSIEPIFLGPSTPGDADCSGTANADDVEGLVTVLFDPASRLTPEDAAFGRCIGADGNADGAETVADLLEAARRIGAP